MSCEHHWHDEGIWEFCCECNAHKCEAIEQIRKLTYKLGSLGTKENLPIEMQATFTAISEEINQILNGTKTPDGTDNK